MAICSNVRAEEAVAGKAEGEVRVAAVAVVVVVVEAVLQGTLTALFLF